MHANDIEEAIQSIDRGAMVEMLEDSLPGYLTFWMARVVVDAILDAFPEAIANITFIDPGKRRELIDSAIDDVVAGNDDVVYITDITDPERSSIEHVVISRGAL